MKAHRLLLFLFCPLVFGAECAGGGGSPDLPTVTLGSAESCPDGQYMDPNSGSCVPDEQLFGQACEDAAESGDYDAIKEVFRAEFCCFTQNNLYFSCPMNPTVTLPLGQGCVCPDSFTGVLWNGVTCGPTE